MITPGALPNPLSPDSGVTPAEVEELERKVFALMLHPVSDNSTVALPDDGIKITDTWSTCYQKDDIQIWLRIPEPGGASIEYGDLNVTVGTPLGRFSNGSEMVKFEHYTPYHHPELGIDYQLETIEFDNKGNSIRPPIKQELVDATRSGDLRVLVEFENQRQAMGLTGKTTRHQYFSLMELLSSLGQENEVDDNLYQLKT